MSFLIARDVVDILLFCLLSPRLFIYFILIFLIN